MTKEILARTVGIMVALSPLALPLTLAAQQGGTSATSVKADAKTDAKTDAKSAPKTSATASSNTSDAEVGDEAVAPSPAATMSPGEAAELEGTPTATPAPGQTPAATPVASPAPAATPTATPKPSYHDATPEIVREKLSVGAGFSLGQGPSKKFSRDWLAYFANVDYEFQKPVVLQAGKVFATVRYFSLTGVNTSENSGYVVSNYLLGGGLNYRVVGIDDVTFSGGLQLGLARAAQWDLNNWEFGKAKYGFTLGTNLRVAVALYEKIQLVPALDLLFGSYPWYGLSLGLSMHF